MAAAVSAREEIAAWFASRIPDGWFCEAPQLTVDREEVLVIGRLREAADDVSAFRESTRAERTRIAGAAESLFGRKVSWGVATSEGIHLFTHLSMPVMTRLRLPDRAVLDTLVDAGIARSRSDALAWCVRLVGRHESEWLAELRDALVHVERARQAGPKSDAAGTEAGT
jgi:hypothetical protein